MKTTFTKQFIEDNCGCYSSEQLYNCSFMQTDGNIHIGDIINSEIPLKDKFWFVVRKCATNEEKRHIAIDVAECVLPIFENKYPNNKAPRKAIKAAKEYLKGQISLSELLSTRQAADAAADAAAYAYAAAAAAADAAAAYAAAYAAAADAAAYAAAAADAAAYSEKLLNILKSKTIELQPI